MEKKEEEALAPGLSLQPYKPLPYKMQILPHKLIVILLFHSLAFYSLLSSTVTEVKWQTHVYTNLEGSCIALGVLVGAHRLWAHRSFKATFGLRLFLAFFFTMSFQESVHQWVRDHRCHHKWTDTDADPYNARRGFFFSHVGWIFLRKHPEVIRQGKTIDMSDIEGDPILAFQRRWFYPLLALIWGILPVFIPAYFWGESLASAFILSLYRTVLIHHATWLVNSWAHWRGSQPYDRRISPVEATIRHAMLGEGFHNYHHAFPWDYSASELAPNEIYNPPTAFIDFCHYMGWASDLRRAKGSLVNAKLNAAGGKDVAGKGNFAKEWIAGLLTYLTLTYLLPLAISYAIKMYRTIRQPSIDSH